MSEPEKAQETAQKELTAWEALKAQLKENVLNPFVDLARSKRAMVGVYFTYVMEGMLYFGILALLPMYFNNYLGVDDRWADWMIMFLTGGITLAMAIFGGVADRWGIRKSLIVALFAMLVGRLILVAGGVTLPLHGGVGSALFWISLVGLLGIILGYGLYQPAAYASVTKFCDKRTEAPAYAMLYALMNLGGFLPALLSPPIRKHFEIPGVFWTYIVLMVLGMIVLMILLTKKVERRAIEEVKAYNREHGGEKKEEAKKSEPLPVQGNAWVRFKSWLKNHPLADLKFAFFIFCLIPVQTLFAHNWLTLPQYVSRALGPVGYENMEFFTNLNPILIFLIAPVAAALTRKSNIYKMMIIGTTVMAAPTFLLAIAPRIDLLIAFILIMTVGEALWQPRFLQYASEIAPPDRKAAYQGVAQFPWFLTKVVTGIYAGWFLIKYCPEAKPNVPVVQDTTTMWLIYGIIAMISPIILILAKGWLGKSIQAKVEAAQAQPSE